MERELYHALAMIAPLLIAILWRYIKKTRTYPRNLPYPPGPKPLPIIGNFYDVPTGAQWRGFHELSQRYGDLLCLRVFGQSMLVLGSLQSTIDLLERRSAIYSDRLQATMISLMGWEWNIGLMPYGSWWRVHRRWFNQYFNKKVSESYTPIQEQQLLKLLKALLVKPDDFLQLVRFSFGASIFKVTYGIEVDDLSNEYLRLAEESLEGLVEGLVPGSFWVDFLPILKYIPAWMPGAQFKRKALKWKISATATKDAPFEAARVAREGGGVHDSVVDKMTARLQQVPFGLDIAKNVSGIEFAAGADTSMSAAQLLFFAMASHPEIQRKAQDQLDVVVGDHRLPTYADRASLPYVDAIVKECLRWQPVLPLGVAHRSIADDEYRGYYIPKGTIVMVNQWALLHDPETYPEPERFNPDRFMKDGKLNPLVRDPSTAAFGFGRRMCPGRHFADNALFLTVASVLHIFALSPPLDPLGQPIHLELKMSHGGLSYPEPFECVIKPRSEARAALIDHKAV